MAENKKQVINFRKRELSKNKVLLTNDCAEHVILTKEEYDKIINEKIDKSLSKKLEEKGFLIDKEDITRHVKKYRAKNSFLFQGTSLHIIVPTLRCNLTCIYCHASKRNASDKGYDMDKQTAKKTVDFIFQTPSQSITIEFQGGEPLLNYDIVKYVIEYAKEKNNSSMKDLKFSLVTNLTLMTEERMKYLLDEDIDICTSLDGQEQLHNKNRPQNSHQLVTKWIKKINEEYKKIGSEKRVNALLTITKDSLKYPKEIIDEYVKFEMSTIHIRFLNNLGDARSEWKEIAYSPDEFMDFWKKAVGYIDEINKNTGKRLIYERMLDIIDTKVTKDYDPNYLDLRSPCGAVIGQLVYNYDGNIYSCDEGRMIGDDIFMVGNVKKNTYKEVTTSPHACSLIMASTNDVYECDACAYKPYCGLCPVCNYAEQGSVIAKIPETARCKIYKAQFDYYFNNIK